MRTLGLILIICLLCVPTLRVMAQPQTDSNPLKEFITENLNSVADSLASPVSKAFATAITGGMYRSASTHGLLGFDLGVRVMGVVIPSGKSIVFDSANVKVFPVPVAQASVGLPMNFEVTARYFGVKVQGADVSLFGVALKKDFSDMIPVPMFPNVAILVGYNKFNAGAGTYMMNQVPGFQGNTLPVDLEINSGDLIKSTSTTFGLIVSKKFGFAVASIQPYAGFTYDHSKVKWHWTTTNTTQGTLLANEPIDTDADVTVNTSRLTLGLDLSPVPFVHLFGDYSFTEYPQFTAGFTLSVR